MYFFKRKVNCFSVLRVKHWINDPFGHKLQITLINVTTFYAFKHWINDPFGHKLQITLINVTTFYA